MEIVDLNFEREYHINKKKISMKKLTCRFETSNNGYSNLHLTICPLWCKMDFHCICCCTKWDEYNVIWTILLKNRDTLFKIQQKRHIIMA